MNDFITRICADLEKTGVRGVPEYKQRLIANSASANFEDFLLEGRAALMFRQAGFGVTLREVPDLALEFNGWIGASAPIEPRADALGYPSLPSSQTPSE